jgi:hypothetical protein
VGKSTEEQRAGWATRLQQICNEMGWFKGPHDRGWRELARAAGLKPPGQIPQIMGKKLGLTHALAQKISAGTGYRTAWILDGDPPPKEDARAAITSEDVEAKALELVHRLSAPPSHEVLEEYLRSRMRLHLRSAKGLRSFAEQLRIKPTMARAIWDRIPIHEDDVAGIMRHLNLDALTVNSWWEKTGRRLMGILAKDDSPRGQGIARAFATGSPRATDAALAVIEAGILSDAADAEAWYTQVRHADEYIRIGVDEVAPRRVKRQAKAPESTRTLPEPEAEPKSKRARRAAQR